jgi:serine-type D-Ala-D-Ala carboxypeptidase/endopeptidase (penicillin-binding protein 4)
MVRFSSFRRLTLGALLALGACAGGTTGLPPPMPEPIAPVVLAPPEAVISPVAETLPIAETIVETPVVVAPAAAPAGRVFAAPASVRPAGTAIGYLLVDLESGIELAGLNPDLPLIPASTTKMATAIVALDVLGPEHRYRTEVLARGEVREGVLRGDLILKGGGDPSLDVADLLELVVRLQARGIRRVDGRFLIDDTALPRFSEIHPTQPLEAAYNPGLGALSLAFNRVRVLWRGGDAVEVVTLPPLSEARFEAIPPSRLPPAGVELKSQGGEDVVWQVADRGGRRQEIALPVKDPGLHAGHVFRWLARAQGVELEAPQRRAAPLDARLVVAHESPPLRQLVRDMLVYSNNMMAELIGLSAAERLGNAEAGLDAAGALLLRHLARLMPEVDWRGATLGNHSGLDGTARLTPRQLAAIARYGWHSEALPALLAAGGWSGTLVNRFAGPDEALRIWAKTGSVNYGSALSGYVFPDSGEAAVFVTMVSDVGARARYDLALRPSPAAQSAARAWNARARALQDELVEGWLKPLPTS